MMKCKGFKLEDTYEINTWFLNTIPNMLQVLKLFSEHTFFIAFGSMQIK